MVDLEARRDRRGQARLCAACCNEHREATGSVNAARVLDNWDEMLPKFVKVMPRDYKRVLAERSARGNGAALAGAAG